MPMILNHQLSFAGLAMQPNNRTHQQLQQINQIIDWKPIEQLLAQYYTKGQAQQGRRAYPPLLLFKMTLLQTWYGLSDCAIEDQLDDRGSFKKFCGLNADHPTPDHSVMARFRKVLTDAEAYQLLLTEVNRQLEALGLLIQKGSIVDASITSTARKPKGKKTYHLPQGEDPLPLEEVKQKGVDQEASWVKRAYQVHYGYKRHYLVDSEQGLVLAVHTTKASEHESQHLSSLLEKVDLPEGSEVLGNKGYSSATNESLLRSKRLKGRLQRKRARGKARSSWSSMYNSLVGGRRYKVERVFGSIKSEGLAVKSRLATRRAGKQSTFTRPSVSIC